MCTLPNVLTVAALLQDPSLGLRVLVPGSSEATERPALWVHNTELPDPSPYVREDELVLTNGLWADSVDADAFVDSLQRARALGLIFGLTRLTPQVPASVVGACERADLLLLSVPIDVPFTAVTQAAARIQAEQRQAALHESVRRSNALAVSLSRGGGAEGVLQVLRRGHDLPLAVVDRTGRQLATAGTELTADQLATLRALLCSANPPASTELPGAGPVTLYLVKGAVGDTDAALVCLRASDSLDPAQRDALHQAALFLSLELAKQQAIQAIESRFSGELLEMVLSGGARAGEIPERLRAFGIDPQRRLAVLAIATVGGDDEASTSHEIVEGYFSQHGVRVLLAAGSQDVVAVFCWEDDERALMVFATGLSRRARASMPDGRLLIGVGDLAEDSYGLKEPLVRAREACVVLRRRTGGPDVASYADVGTHGMLLALHEPTVLRRFADDVLGTIRDHDARNGTDLETTLRVFLSNDGQWSVTAHQLFIHVNTLRNRLQRISELTGRDLARLDERVNLFLALEADAMS